MRGLWGVFAALFFVNSVTAHAPVDGELRAFQFPDLFIPSVDGDLSDWDLVDSSYALRTEVFVDLVSDETIVDGGDFSVRLMVGWNKQQNRLYVAAEVSDDLHQIDRPPGTAQSRIFQDDDMEVFVDADHSGGQYANFVELGEEEQLRLNGAEANHFVLAGPPPDDDFFVNFSAAAWYSQADGAFTQAAVAHENMGTGTVTRYEMMLVPFDTVNMDAAVLSSQHVLQEQEIIGFNVEFNDFDLNSELFDAKWSLTGQQNSFRFADRFADLRLMPLEEIFQPTSVEATNWGLIKSAFSKGQF